MADEISTTEILDFLRENMLTKEEGTTKADLSKMATKSETDKILSTVIDTQASVKELGDRVEHVEYVQQKTYDKLDGFLTLIDRHEAEIAALRSKYERLEERIVKLETQQA